MKRLRITVDGVTYEVEVEVLEDDDEIGGYGYGASSLPPSAITPPATSKPAAPATPPATPSPTPAPPPAPTAGAGPSGNTLTSPIAGLVRDIKVKAGDTVAENAPVIILEAMKMETVVSSPVAGEIAEVNVENGQSVQQGQILVTFK